jgi:hypothetical protein
LAPFFLPDAGEQAGAGHFSNPPIGDCDWYVTEFTDLWYAQSLPIGGAHDLQSVTISHESTNLLLMIDEPLHGNSMILSR